MEDRGYAFFEEGDMPSHPHDLQHIPLSSLLDAQLEPAATSRSEHLEFFLPHFQLKCQYVISYKSVVRQIHI